MTAKTAELYADQARRVERVINWHTAAPKYRNLRLCKECGMPWPCRTRLELLGRQNRRNAP